MTSIEEFRRLWPEIAEHAIPGMVDNLVEMDQRHRFLRLLSPFTDLYSLLALPLILFLLLLSCSGVILIPAYFLARSIFPSISRSAFRFTLPGLSRRIVASGGQLAVDCYLAGLTYRQISATEAMATYMHIRRSESRTAFILVIWLIACALFLKVWQPLDPKFLTSCLSMTVICAILHSMMPRLQMLQRLRMIYNACSLKYAPSADYRGAKPSTRKDNIRFGLFLALLTCSIWAFLIIGLIVYLEIYLENFHFQLSMFWKAMLFVWTFVIPALAIMRSPNLDNAYGEHCKDGQIRLEELVQYLAER